MIDDDEWESMMRGGSDRGESTKTRVNRLIFKANDNKKSGRGGEQGPEDYNGPRFEILKLLMLSSKSSVTHVWQDLRSTGF